jgi:SAM-dependent methyltransferase
VSDDRWIELGHPSYVWRFGQERRLSLVRRHVPLEGKRILDVGCGLGAYVEQFRRFSDEVHGVDVDLERVARASAKLPNIQVAPAESLPFPDASFDVAFSNEVIEHVEDDRKAIAEAVRVTANGGHVVVYAPNRLYPFETHGAYFGKRFVFRLIPLVNYLPDALRNRFCPHVRAYWPRQIEGLFRGLQAEIVVHTYVYPGFDNIVERRPVLGRVLRGVFYVLENTPLRVFGLSHFVVARVRRPGVGRSGG